MPNWTNEQKMAIEKSGSNIIVSAGAGSGKTAVLSERVIEKLKKGIKVNELLILTFTNAAAGEMKERIRKKISKEPTLSENLTLLESSYITTFDAFTLALVKKYHYILNIPNNFSIIDASIINIKKNEILDNVFNQMYEESNFRFTKFINDFCIKNDTLLKEALLRIIAKVDLKSDKNTFLDNYVELFLSKEKIKEYVDKYTKTIRDIISDIESALYLIAETEFQDYSVKMNAALDKLIKSITYDEAKKAISVSLPRRPKDSEELEEYKNQIANDIKLLKDYLRFENEDEIYETLYQTREYCEVICIILKRYYEQIEKYKYENDVYEFTDVELMAIKILKENKDICDEIKQFYKEIMIDEYQDTSDLQEEFVSLIENDNVYMVGDVKQSIYGFRNANPMIFKNKYDKYSLCDGGIKIDLLKNFRSRSEVLNGINEIFSVIMDNEIGGAFYIRDHQMIFGNTTYTENKAEQNYDLEIIDYFDDNASYTKDEIEAFIIAKDIKEKIKNKYQVLDKDGGFLRLARYEDFCIIMDRGSSFNLYKKIFEYEKIPLTVFEDKKLTTEVDVMLINNLIGLMCKIKNNLFDKEFKYYFISVARSPLFEYTDEQIFKVFMDNSYKETEIYIKMKNLCQKVKLYSNVEIINALCEEFNIYENIIKIGNVEDIIVRIDYLKDSAISLSNLGYTIEDMHEYFTKMIRGNDEIKYKDTNVFANSVKIMNIHKSKGLEFPVCYFSGYSKKFNTMDVKERFVYDNQYGIITPFYKEGIGSTILKDLLKDKFNIDNISERIRLFYVALTRAREKMIIVLPKNEKALKLSNKVPLEIRKKYNSFLSIMSSINMDKLTRTIDINKIGLTKDYTKVIKDNLDLEEKTEVLTFDTIEVENEVLEKRHASKVIEELIDDEKKKTLEYGTKIHELFETEDFLTSKVKEVQNLVNKLALTENDRILKEHEFIYEENGGITHGIIDLIVESENEIKIIDYKLMGIDDPNYKKQLKTYHSYIRQISKKEIRVFLYSILKDELREIKI